jgi:hypothetical protein
VSADEILTAPPHVTYKGILTARKSGSNDERSGHSSRLGHTHRHGHTDGQTHSMTAIADHFIEMICLKSKINIGEVGKMAKIQKMGPDAQNSTKSIQIPTMGVSRCERNFDVENCSP